MLTHKKLLLSGKTIISHPEVYRTVVSINIETPDFITFLRHQIAQNENQ